MNPIIAHDLMQARIADMHRQASRTSTGKTAHTAMSHLRRSIIGLVATAMALLVDAPAALAIRVPPPGENSGAPPPVVVHPAAAGGMPGWQIVLIAAGSALLASALTLLAVRMARHATQAQPSHP
jgi:hypothetical protein